MNDGPDDHAANVDSASPVQLRKTLNLPLMVLYGLGTTVGAGIYALVGEIAGASGYLAPLSFLVACSLAALTALSFAELSSRYPKAGAAALYVQRGFRSNRAALAVGLLVATTGVVSCAALINGFTGYAQTFVEVDRAIVVVATAAVLTAIAAWGVTESVIVASIVSVVEVGGLLWIVFLNAGSMEVTAASFDAITNDLDIGSAGILAGAMLAFYAFIGFEDMVDMAEEVKDVRRTMPAAILTTLAITAVIYVVLMSTAVLAIAPDVLAQSDAPLATLYEHATGKSPVVIGIIGMFAIINGAMIQVMMASRVLYGLASRDQLPRMLASINPRTQTPLLTTILVGLAVTLLALAGRLAGLAEATSVLMLVVFATVNLALWRIKGRGEDPATTVQGFRTPRWVALLGATVCVGFVLLGLAA